MHRDGVLPTLLVSLLFVGHALADGSESARTAKSARPRHSGQVTAEQETEVLRFVREHHAELAELLGHLQSSSLSDYQEAIRDLWHARDRLKQIEQRDRGRYELELDAWVVQSRIQLLVARLAVKEHDDLRDELRSLLGQRVDLKLRLLLGERQRLTERLGKVDEQIDQHETGRSELIEKQFMLLTKSSKRLKRKKVELLTKKGLSPSKPNSADGEP